MADSTSSSRRGDEAGLLCHGPNTDRTRTGAEAERSAGRRPVRPRRSRSPFSSGGGPTARSRRRSYGGSPGKPRGSFYETVGRGGGLTTRSVRGDGVGFDFVVDGLAGN